MREESRVTSRILARAAGKIELPLTGKGKITEGADLWGDQEFSFGLKCETLLIQIQRQSTGLPGNLLGPRAKPGSILSLSQRQKEDLPNKTKDSSVR